VARDRKRAKQRRDRRGTRATRRSAAATDAIPQAQPERADVPGALDHASSDVDEFDAALVRGADGVAATPEVEQELEREAEEELASPEPLPADGDGGRRGGGGAEALTVGPGREGAPAARRGGNRALAFLQASWAELQRVQWPDRRQTTQATAVVLGFVVVAGAYLGVADLVAGEIVEFVLG
jgi:preprotein translocase subunit SecE